jgi:hypothetical protein
MKELDSIVHMSRCFAAIIAAAAVALAQESPGGPALPTWNVLYGASEFRDAHTMFSAYLAKLRGEEQARRSKLIADLASPADIRQYQTETRAKLWAALGGLPQRTPLNARVTGVLEREGYRVEKVIYESRPRYYVTGNLYVPRNGTAPYPAVLAPVQLRRVLARSDRRARGRLRPSPGGGSDVVPRRA